MIDFSALKKLSHADIVSNKSFSPINVRISDKKLLMMVREIQEVIDENIPPQTIIESMIVHTYKQLKKEGKV